MKKIFLVVDYQNDFVNGALGFPGADKLDEGIANKIEESAKEGYCIAYTLDTHYEDYLETREGKALPITHCIKNSQGWMPYGKTKDALSKHNAVCITKETFGANPKSIMESELPDKDVEEIFITGLVTNMCVISNACVFQAIYPQAQIVVDSSLCNSFDSELHDKTLDVLKGLQVKVI